MTQKIMLEELLFFKKLVFNWNVVLGAYCLQTAYGLLKRLNSVWSITAKLTMLYPKLTFITSYWASKLGLFFLSFWQNDECVSLQDIPFSVLSSPEPQDADAPCKVNWHCFAEWWHKLWILSQSDLKTQYKTEARNNFTLQSHYFIATIYSLYLQ